MARPCSRRSCAFDLLRLAYPSYLYTCVYGPPALHWRRPACCPWPPALHWRAAHVMPMLLEPLLAALRPVRDLRPLHSLPCRSSKVADGTQTLSASLRLHRRCPSASSQRSAGRDGPLCTHAPVRNEAVWCELAVPGGPLVPCRWSQSLSVSHNTRRLPSAPGLHPHGKPTPC